MAKNYKLSDEEKEKAKSLLNQLNNRENKTTSKKVETTVKENDEKTINNRQPSYRQGISITEAPTARVSNDDIARGISNVLASLRDRRQKESNKNRESYSSNMDKIPIYEANLRSEDRERTSDNNEINSNNNKKIEIISENSLITTAKDNERENSPLPISKALNIKEIRDTISRAREEEKEEIKFNKMPEITEEEIKQYETGRNARMSADNSNKKISQNLKKGIENTLMQIPYYMENEMTANVPEYAKRRETQYLTSNKVNEEEKMAYESALRNRLVDSNGRNVSEEYLKKLETNLISKDLEEKIDSNQQKINQNVQHINDPIARKVAELAPSIGQMSVSTGASAINPVLGATLFSLSASGGYIKDAKDRGMNRNDSVNYGTIMGIIEGVTEQLPIGKMLGAGKKAGKSMIKNALKEYGISIAENAIQEAIIEPISEATATLTGGEETANWEGMSQRMLQSAIDGALVAIVVSGANAGVGSAQNIYTKMSNGETITKKELSNTIKEIQDSNKIDIDKIIADSVIEQIKNNQIDNNVLPTARSTSQNVANNQEVLYNNNESESGLNEQIQQSRLLESNNGLSRVFEENGNQESRKYTRTEFEQWEKSIKPITESKLSGEQKQIKENLKRQYDKDIVFFDGKNNKNGYSAGTSYNDSKRINIDINQAKEFGTNKIIYHEVMESNILHNLESNKDIIEPALQKIIDDPNFEQQKIKFWQGQNESMPSDYLIAKELLCDRYAEIKTGERWDYDNVLSQETNMTIDFAIENFEKQLNNKKPDNDILENAGNSDLKTPENKILNPTEISNLKPEDASTTPKLQNKKYQNGNKQSSFYSNITEKSKFLNEDFRNVMKQDENIEYYKTVSNKDTLEKAYNKLKEDGQKEVVKWYSKDSKKATSEDVAEGWILLKQYQDAGDYDSAVEVAKKMRDIGTTAGQTVQAYNILSRLTPEGMFYYAQSELSEAYSKMVEGKSKKWIDANKDKFDLTPEETKFIMDTMQDVSKMEDGYNKKVKLAEIQKIITDKIPATTGQSIKAWMRISMLFNPKTQVRNVMGNAVITPVNMFSDSVSAGIDKLISKKTGIRTTGNTNIKNYAKGFRKGLYESYNDFKKGINTRNIEGNRFEVSEGKNFNNKGLGKALNRVDNLLSFMLDAGDRGFYEATFTNSINNQLVLNNTTEVTQEMIDIATTEALQRTWQDNNNYTKAVLGIRKILNNVNVKGYGLGDVLIPFAKTPANLTKAIVDYSPVGLVKTLTSDAIKLKNSFENGQYTPQLQHQFVQNLGKATAGSFLYVLGYALAQAGVITGEADEDKDVKNFMKNSLGINSYSIKIGDKSFSYDWAQPIATPFTIMANYVKYSNDNPEASAIDKAINAMNIGTEQLLQQSFMESLNTVLNGSGTTLENLSQAVLELPSRAIPTFSKQIADMVDSTQRTSFEYDKPIQSAINSIIAKIPFASKTLPASVDTLGNEIKKYGGDNNIFNVFLNPANMNKGELSKAGEEIYNIYQETGDTTIFPRTAPYYINNKGEKITMTARERSEFQRISGTYVEDTLTGLLNNKDYKKLSNEEKGKLINEIVSDSYSKAKYDVLNLDSEEYEKLRKTLKTVKATNYYDYKFKTKDLKTDKEKMSVLANTKYADKEKTTLYETYILSDSDEKYPIIKETFTPNGLNITKYLDYKAQEFTSDKEDDGTVDGKSVSGSKKEKVVNYIDSIEGATYTQKLILLGLEYSLSDYEKSQIVNYIDSLDKTNEEKLDILSNFKGFTIYKDGTFDY